MGAHPQLVKVYFFTFFGTRIFQQAGVRRWVFSVVFLLSFQFASAQTGCDCPAIDECGPCVGGINSLTVRYNGPLLPALVTVKDGNGATVFGPGTMVLVGQSFTFNSGSPSAPFGGNQITISGNLDILGGPLTPATVSTACGAGLQIGIPIENFTVMSGTSVGGGALCCEESDMENIPPATPVCPGNITVGLDPGQCSKVVNWVSPVVPSDNCGNVTLTSTHDPGDAFGVGTTTVQYTATDDYGNTSSCSFDITVNDGIDPEIICPGSFTVPANVNCEVIIPDYTGLVEPTDNCDNDVTVTQFPLAGTILEGAGTIQTITLTATDDYGNSADCTFDITVIDVILPQVPCPADFDVAADENCQFEIPDYANLALATDNCDDDVVVTQVPPVGTILTGEGTTQNIVLTAVDDSGNIRTCNFDITLIDTIDPVITCPADFDVSAGPECEFPLPDYTGMAIATDNCDTDIAITQDPPVGHLVSGAGSTQLITLTATDNAGNTAECSFTITLIDDIDPEITCPASFDVSTDATCDFLIPDYTDLANATDNCDADVEVTQVPAVGTPLSGVGTSQLITLTATDNAGNTKDCSFTITLIDDTDPAIACPASFDVATDAACEFLVPDYTGLASATDNCDADVEVTQDPPAGTLLSGVGINQLITLTATDDSGNTNECSFTITLIDDIDPEITCPANFDVATDAACEFLVPDYTGLATATDNCDTDVDVTQVPAIGTMLTGVGTAQVITLTATDDAGNTRDCSFTITLIDDIDPAITCPASFDVATDANCKFLVPDYTGLASATDNCDADVDVTQVPPVGTELTGEGTTQLITLTATDDSGNTKGCSFTITLIDDIAPAITCPVDFDVATDVNCEFVIPDYTGLAAVSDNCDNDVAVTQDPSAGTSLSGHGTTQLITLTATDNAGNTNACTFTITLIDDIDPAITCPADFDVATDQNCDFVIPDYTGLATANDNCDTEVAVTQNPPVGTPLSGAGTTQVVTLTATDNAGNTADCSFTITLTDDIDPDITCPANFDVATDQNCEFLLPDYSSLASAGDNCDSGVSIAQDPAVGTLLSGSGTTQLITLTATDDSGNTTQCSFTITLIDDIDPQITCPPGMEVATDADCEFLVPDYRGLGVATDNCDSDVEITQSPAVGTLLAGVGTEQIITLTATDDSGNTSDCSFTITLIDDIDPVITCAASFDVTTDANCEFLISDYTALASSSDNCDADLTIAQDPPIGTILSGAGTTQIITLTAIDDAGNSKDCSFTITLIDNIAPAITCPADFDVVADVNGEFHVPDYTNLATATDNCDADVEVVQDVTAGTTLSGAGTLQTITLTATDNGGNSSSCSFAITVVDQAPPVIVGPANFSVSADANGEFLLADYSALASVSDNCDDAPVITQEPSAGTLLSGAGIAQLVTLTAEDDSGNSTDWSFTITVVDDMKPVIDCLQNSEVMASAECVFVVPDYATSLSVSDNTDDEVAVVQLPAAGTELAVGAVQTITVTATDDSGNSSDCLFTLTVVDGTAPSIVCPGDIEVSVDDDCTFLIPDYTGLITPSDNCDQDIAVSQHPVAGTAVSGVGTEQVITLTAIDDADNSINCSFMITLVDDTAPSISCQGDLEVMVGQTCEFIVPDYLGRATASDNCDATLALSQLPAAGMVLSDFGTEQIITITATDDSGNSASCTFKVTLKDNIGPKFTSCNNAAIVADAAPDDCGTPVSWTAPLATDNCGVTLTSTHSPGDRFPTGKTTVVYTATDAAGNKATCDFIVIVRDKIAPVISGCPATDIVVFTTDQCGVNVQWDAPTASDNCFVELTSTHQPGDFFEVGTTEVVYTASDTSENETTCTFKVIVIDNSAPVFSGCPTGIIISAVDVCQPTVSWTPPSVSGNCTDITVTSSHDPGDAFPIGETEVVYTASDPSGNSSACSFIVKVIDEGKPVFNVCPQPDVFAAAGTSCETTATWVAPSVTDCDDYILTSTHASGAVFPVGTTTVVYTATDKSGNSSTCTLDIVVEDKAAPAFANCPGNINVFLTDGCSASATWTEPSVTDNCGLESVTATHAPGATFAKGVTEVTYTAIDIYGNKSTCTFSVNVQNQHPPVISGCSEDIVLRADYSGEVAAQWPLPVATTTCGEVSLQSNYNPGDYFSVGSTTVTYTATDSDGNTASCSFNVLVAYDEVQFDLVRVITPDGDGINDVWKLGNIEKFPENKVVIVDRWGSVIYSATAYNNENIVWRGVNSSGAVVPTGTYFYTISVRVGEELMQRRGFIELIQ